MWEAFDRHVQKIEESFWEMEYLLDKDIQNVCISLDGGTESDVG